MSNTPSPHENTGSTSAPTSEPATDPTTDPTLAATASPSPPEGENPMAVGGDDLTTKKSHALVVQFRELDKKADNWIQSWNPYHPDVVKGRTLQPILIEESQIRKKTARIFLIGFGLFMLWAFFAPIDGGVGAPGTVMVSGYRKTLSHPTGGLIQDILVKEGQEVNEGDILIRINPLRAEAELTAAQLGYINVLVTEARFQAERRGDKKIIWPSELEAMGSDPRVAEAKKTQQKLFETRYNEFGVALNARRSQLASLSEEARNLQELAKDGYVPRSQANQAARTRTEAEMSLNTLQAGYYKEIDGQLAEIQKNRDALKTRLEAVAFDRDLTSIRAPITGTLVGLKVNTVGANVGAGQVLAEIVPKELALMVDVQVPPTLIDKVKIGSKADMRFSSFNADTTPSIPGLVKLVSADKKPGAQAGPGGKDEDYYLAQVEATPEGLAKLGSLKILPGMPVDVVFKTGERTFVSLLTKPLTDKLIKGFESR
jgi:protease secretion system membrane fusion protein